MTADPLRDAEFLALCKRFGVGGQGGGSLVPWMNAPACMTLVHIFWEHGKAAGSAANRCPDANILACFVDGTLGEEERASVVRHAADCDDCRIIVADVAAMPEIRS